MCGRGGVAGVAAMTSRQGCVESTGRQSLQGPENGQRALRRQAGRKIEKQKNWRQKIRNFAPGLRLWNRREENEEKEPQEGQGLPPRRG